MKRVAPESNPLWSWAVSLTLVAMLILLLVPIGAEVHAQCIPLQASVCRDTVGGHDWSFNQTYHWWSVVGVVPSQFDDKDIYLYSVCPATGILASSNGTSGADFIVGDFNHNATGTYYPRTQYGSPTDPNTVVWIQDDNLVPVSQSRLDNIGGYFGQCTQFATWDVYLEAGAEYEFRFSSPSSYEASLAFFRNPAASTYWAGRFESEFEITGNPVTQYYAAPASDWYGIVVFPTWRSPSDLYQIEVEKLFDCTPLESGTPLIAKEYTPADGPNDNFSFGQTQPYWSVVSVVPEETDYKSVEVYSECDNNGTRYGGATMGIGLATFVVADFNHTPAGDYFPVVSAGAETDSFTIEWEEGGAIFPTPGDLVNDFYGSAAAEPNIVHVWDVYMEAGKQYDFFFYEWGDADPHLALFRNSTTSPYWATRSYAEWEITGSGGYHKNYTAPATDYYGLVAFADAREEWGLYQVRFQELNDCIPLTSGECVVSSHFPRDFSFTPTSQFWGLIGIVPDDEDYKHVDVFTQCDQKGTHMASSTSYVGANFVVGDFNHTPITTYYANSYDGDSYLPFVVSCDVGADLGEDILPYNEFVSGDVSGTGGECGRFKIWDIYLEAGVTYSVSFTRSGNADVKLALFHNPGSGTYWSGRSGSEFEMPKSGVHSYTAPADDWYGVVVFANHRDAYGNYTIRISQEGVTGIEENPELPEAFALYQNAPNPFNPWTLIRYDVPAGGGKVSLRVYDVTGQLVRTLIDRVEPPGPRSVEWDGRDNNGSVLPAGVYFCRLNTEGFSETRKVLLVK